MMATSADEAKGELIRGAESVVAALLRVASYARFFHSADGRFHAQVPVGDRREIYGLNSTAFRDWLIETYRRERGDVPSSSSVGRALTALEARARFDADVPAVYVRVGRDGEGSGADCYLDIGDSTGRAVKISAEEWLVIDRPPVHFRRPEGLMPLPIPARDGSIELVRRYVNLTEQDFRLLVGWMAAALLPEGPYPVLAIHGEQGSAKSTLVKVVRQLIDPQSSAVLAEPRSARDLMVTAVNGWLLAYDNISVLPNWLSDSICRLATGGGLASRALFSNDERNVINAQRPVILNGIDEFVCRDDLADRCVFLHLVPISAGSRRTEREFWRSFRADYPSLLGGLLNAAVGGVRELPSVQLAELPRMADFACFGEAVGRGLGWPRGAFVSAYSDNRRETGMTALEESVVATALLDRAGVGGLLNWTLTATEMLRRLGEDVSVKVRASARWPKSPKAFSNELRRIAPLLRTRGISVKFTKTRDNRLITVDADRSFDRSTAPHCSNGREVRASDGVTV